MLSKVCLLAHKKFKMVKRWKDEWMNQRNEKVIEPFSDSFNSKIQLLPRSPSTPMTSTLAPQGFFITGTDTEVGKSLVAGAVIHRLQERNLRVAGFKPVVAGTLWTPQGVKINEDLETLRLSSHAQLSAKDICPYILDEAAAPHLVAHELGIELDLDLMVSHYQKLAAQFDAMVVEGAGGFLVPINFHQTLGDLAQRLMLPVIMVVGMRLGCINHALLTEQCIASKGLQLHGWVANCIDQDMGRLDENIQTLQKMLQAPHLGTIPYLKAQHLSAKLDARGAYSPLGIAFAAQQLSALV